MVKDFLGDRVRVAVGDITRRTTDAIVNAANSTLLGGGGVDGAIHRAGGAKILEECRAIRRTQFPEGLPTGESRYHHGRLAARFVIYTVGPIYGQNQGGDGELLADCYKNCPLLAAENNLTSVAFPSISTGAFYYPKPEAARAASVAINGFLSQDENIKEIRLVFFFG